jgi:pimeloyl-ACP methyl ester carboxylesterase
MGGLQALHWIGSRRPQSRRMSLPLFSACLAASLLAACDLGSSVRPGQTDLATTDESATPTLASEADCSNLLRKATRVAHLGYRAFLFGHGPTGLIFSNQSDRDLCSWLPFARQLAASQHLTVLLYDYSGTVEREADLTDAAHELKRRGKHRIVLIGASAGAIASLDAATTIEPPVAGVVCLSAEWLPDELGVPALLLSSRDDGYVSPETIRPMYQRMASRHKQLEILPGGAHGSDLLAGVNADWVRDQIREFLDEVT